MSNYPPPPPGQPPYPPPEGVPTRPMNPQQHPQGYQQNPYGQQPPYPPPGQQPKKGGAGKWILLGCVGFLIIGGLIAGGVVWMGYNKAKEMGLDPELLRKNPALAAAKIAIKNDPDKEFVSIDETNNTITVRDKKSGKVVTLSVEQDKNGHVIFKGKDESGKETSINIDGGSNGGIEVKSSDGNVKIGGGSTGTLPDWVPQYPNAKIEGNFSTESDESIGRNYSFKTNDSTQQVISYFEDKLKAQGWKVSKTTSEVNGKSYMSLSSNDGNYKRFVVVSANEQDGGVYVTVTSQENKKKG